MGRRLGPDNPGLNGKAGNKDDKAGNIRSTVDDAWPESMKQDAGLTVSTELLERLERTLSSLPTVDSIRVAEVKAAIESGEYETDPQAIADAMIRFERSLGE